MTSSAAMEFSSRIVTFPRSRVDTIRFPVWPPNSKVIAIGRRANKQSHMYSRSGDPGNYCCVVFSIESASGNLIDSKSLRVNYIECLDGLSYESTADNMILSYDGTQVALKFATAEGGTVVGVFDTSTSRCLAKLPMVTASGGAEDLDLHGFSREGTVLITSYRVGPNTGYESVHNITAWDAKEWKPKWKLGYPEVFASFGPKDGQATTCSGTNWEVASSGTVWDIASGRKLGTIGQPKKHSYENASRTFGVDLMADGTLELWDLRKNRIKAVLGRPSKYERGQFAVPADGRYVMSESNIDGVFEVWDTAAADRTADLAAYRATRPRKYSAEPPLYLWEKAPPVSNAAYERICVGMLPQDVWEIFGGQPIRSNDDVSREDIVTAGTVLEEVDWKYSSVEVYVGNGGPTSKVVLFYHGDTILPPLVRKFEVGLK